MKKNKMIAALAVTAMVMCAVAPANVVYATEVTESTPQTVSAIAEVKALIPENIDLDRTEWESLRFDTTDRTSYSGALETVEAINEAIKETDYKAVWAQHKKSQTLHDGDRIVDLSRMEYRVENKYDSSDYFESTVGVTYNNSSNRNTTDSEKVSAVEADLFSKSGTLTYVSETKYNNHYKNNTNAFNTYLTDTGVFIKSISDHVIDESWSDEYIGLVSTTLYYFVDEVCYGGHDYYIAITADKEQVQSTITDGITFVGEIGAKISAAVLETTGNTYKMMTEAVQAMGYEEIFSAHEFTLEEGDISDGITITFNVGTKNNGREAIVLHQLQNGEFEEFKSIVSDGVVTAKVTELSPFVVALGEVVEGDIVDGLDDEPQTGEGNFGFLFYTACLALGAVLLVKRKEA